MTTNRIRVSLNASCVGARDLSILEFADLATRHEFDGIDIPNMTAVMRFAPEIGGVLALKDELAKRAVAPVIFGLAPERGFEGIEWRKDEETFQRSLGELLHMAGFAEKLGLTRCYTYLPPAVNANPDDFENVLAMRVAEMARLLGAHQIRLGVEWLGPHHLRAGGTNATGTNPFIFSMPRTLAFINKVDVPTVGLILDSLHCYTASVQESDIAALSASQIVHTHLSDVNKGKGPSGARADERILPGEGEIDLFGFMRGLRETAYQGYVAVEVIAPKNIADTPDQAAAKIRSSLRKLAL